MSQKDIASALGIGYRSWQGYEDGSNVPGGNVFEGLSRLGINMNWLFSGAGFQLRDYGKEDERGCEVRAECFKKMRGNLSIPEFVKKLGLAGHESLWTATFQDIESCKANPTIDLLLVLHEELGINPSWIVTGDGPMYNSETDGKIERKDLDRNLLKATIEAIEEIDGEDKLLSPEQRSELASLVYYMNQGTKYTKNKLVRFIEAICILLEQGVDFNNIPDWKMDQHMLEIAHHVVKGGDD